jgi:transcriptional/translational regulatory protein YebC/TACO1
MPKAYEEQAFTAEGYGPGGTAVMIACVSAGESANEMAIAALREQVRSVLLRHGGRGGATNSVAYLFHRVGVLRCPATGRLAATAFAAGAEDVVKLPDGRVEVITDPEDLESVRLQLQAAGHAVLAATVTRRAAQSLPLNAADTLRLQQLTTELRALAGVENVYTNGQIPEQFLAHV